MRIKSNKTMSETSVRNLKYSVLEILLLKIVKYSLTTTVLVIRWVNNIHDIEY